MSFNQQIKTKVCRICSMWWNHKLTLIVKLMQHFPLNWVYSKSCSWLPQVFEFSQLLIVLVCNSDARVSLYQWLCIDFYFYFEHLSDRENCPFHTRLETGNCRKLKPVKSNTIRQAMCIENIDMFQCGFMSNLSN